MPVATIEEALEDIRQGKMVILMDDQNRENEGDLTMAAELVTPEAINFMATWGRGLICLTLIEEKGRPARPYHDGPGQTRRPSAPRSRSPSTVSRTSPRVYRPRTGPRPSWRPSGTTPDPRTCARPATSSRYGPGPAACWYARVRPRVPWTFAGWRGSSPPA